VTSTVPAPARAPDQRRVRRRQPIRCGVVNIWDFVDEEFCFGDGRLVLRGDNGTGKTKVLELVYPFVLDGRIDARRLNPFASEARTMKSNLLWRGQDTAYGYAWMEFARRDPVVGTVSDPVTVGIGLRAQKHNEKVNTWFFVVAGRVGVDFSLIGPDDRPLTRAELIARLGPDAVIDRSRDHRAAVDRALFGLGTERFEQLLSLLLTLRRPKLAEGLDPAKLSETLRDGLRPLDERLIDEAARSFDALEAVQRRLDALVAADEGIRSFLAVYSTYVRTHARLEVNQVDARRRAAREAARSVEHARAEHQEAEKAVAVAARQLRDARTDLAGTRTRIEGLKDCEAYRQHGQIADLERHVATWRAAVRDAEGDVGRCDADRERAAREADAAGARVTELAARQSRASAELAGAARGAGVDWAVDDNEPEGFSVRLTARVTARRDAVREVGQAMDARDRAEHALTIARRRVAEAEEAFGRAQEQLAAAEAAVATARELLQDALGSWDAGYRGELASLEVEGALPTLLDAVGGDEPESPVAILDRMCDPARRRLHTDDALLVARTRELSGRLADERATRERIAAERDDAPAAHPHRRADRAGRAGAPLWRLVRFADGVGAAEQGPVEEALAAAGLLDAWVAPAPEAGFVDDDAALEPLAPSARPRGRTLADLLVVEDQQHVAPQRVAALLGSVAVLDGVADGGADRVADGGADERAGEAAGGAVGTDGRYRIGVLSGSARKPAAEFVGATARAARRAARLAVCDARIAAVESDLSEARAAREGIRLAGQALDAARDALPAVRPLLAALRRRNDAAAALVPRREELDRALGAADAAGAARSDAQRRVALLAAQRSLPTDRDGLGAVDRALTGMEMSGREVADARRAVAAGQREAQEAAARRQREQARYDDALHRRDRASLVHEEHRQRLDALRANVGAEAEQVMRDLAAAQDRLSRLENDERWAEEALTAARVRSTSAETAARERRSGLVTALTELAGAARRLAPYARPEVLAVVRPGADVTWPAEAADWPEPSAAADSGADPVPAPVTELEKVITDATGGLSPTENSVKQTTSRLTAALETLDRQLALAGHEYRPEWDAADEIITVRVLDDEGRSSVSAFALRVAEHRRTQELLLSDAERKVLEDALLTRLSSQIFERTVDARDLSRRMDAEMRTRRTSSGATVGVRWELDDGLDPEQRAVLHLLEKDASRLGPEELARLRDHFASRISAARARDTQRPYHELLAEVLDYRRWRQFAFSLVRPDGEERLTKTRHSSLSGGEQSVSLHLPLFAAAHTTFGSGRQDCPRLIALDEAFAGVDETGTAELLGLAVQFDLDMFMTGYNLWVTYPQVPAAAHYDLARDAKAHTVSSLLMLWDGQVTHEDAGVSDDLSGRLSGDAYGFARPAREFARWIDTPGTRAVRSADGGLDQMYLNAPGGR
jgi:uncharacterized protein (TIGR02680 family)